MIKRISNWLYRISNGWLVLGALLVFLLFSILVLPGQSASAEAVSADAGSPDMSFYYSTDDLYRMAESYGQAGRDAYIRARFTFDLVWPVVYTLFLTTAVSWIYARAFPQNFKFWWVNLLPLLGMIFDYLENISTSLVMFRYPQPTPLADSLAPVFTMLKWTLISGSFLLLIAGILILMKQRFVQK